MKVRNKSPYLACVGAALLSLTAPVAPAQTTAAPAASPAAPSNKPALKQEELEQLIAPIALYPDTLLTQMFMASTYPLEIVQADRWTKAHKDLKGDALAKELESQPWDPSVKSMVNFPTVLATMSEKLDLTVKLGDAFIGQQADVLSTVQSLRAKAKAQGSLKTTEQQKVSVEPAAGQTTQVITIESSSPEVIYVPVYSPTMVYGTWPYPAYPPYPYYPPYPPGYVAFPAVGFGVGLVCGVAWGYAWGHCNWGHGDIDIDINRNINFNHNINRNNYQANFNRNNTNIGGGGNWQHDPSHRQGVPYRDQASSQKFGGARQSADAAKARDAFRGRSDVGRMDTPRSGAFDGAGTSGARTASQRGQSSRGSRHSAPSRGGRGGGSRGGRR